MFNQKGGLLLEQAPPIFVVLRFFVTGAIFGVLLGLFLIATSIGIFDISNYSRDLIATHFLFLGVEASFMLGALFQMLPVLAGVIIRVPTKKSIVVNVLLVLGILFQAVSFYSANYYPISAFILGGGLLYVTYLMINELRVVETHSNTSKGMMYAILGLGFVVIVGVLMLLMLGGNIDIFYNFSEIREFHYTFGFIGWILVLIIAISFQVVEMFFITPKYPEVVYKYTIPALFALTIIKIFFDFYIDELIGILSIGYAITTLYLLYKRKRPTSDASVWFWRLGMVLLIMFSLSLFLNELKLSYMLFVGFSLSIIFAMVYKIVPFLVWFHLSSQGYMKAPMMHEVIKPKVAKVHFYIHVLSMFALLSTVFINILYLNILVYSIFTISFGFLLWNILKGIYRYNYTKKNSTPMRW
jgi:hypothetical protein